MIFFSLQTTQSPIEEEQEANLNEDGSPKNNEDNQQNPQVEEEMADTNENAANQTAENKELESEEGSSSDSEKTLSESIKESSKPYVTPGKAELSAAQKAEVAKAKIAQAVKEIAEEEALAKKKADKAMKKAIKAAKKKEKEVLAALAAKATKIKSSPKSGRNVTKQPRTKMMVTKRTALRKKDYVTIPMDDSEESMTDPEPLRQRRSKMKHDPTSRVEIPPRQNAAENPNNSNESEASSPQGHGDQVFTRSLNCCF